jgi:hypothetical protein
MRYGIEIYYATINILTNLCKSFFCFRMWTLRGLCSYQVIAIQNKIKFLKEFLSREGGDGMNLYFYIPGHRHNPVIFPV